MEPISETRRAEEESGGSGAGVFFESLYSELHRMAAREVARHGGAQALSATTLLHEAYLDMAKRSEPHFPDRGRFMGYAARVMRGLIIDHARRCCALKRGGQFELTGTPVEEVSAAADHGELTRLSDALDELAKSEPALAELVDLKFFCGFSLIEIAAMRGVTERTAQRQWEKARIFLHRSLREGPLL